MPTACPITSTGACDDGLAYDTPRDINGNPLREDTLSSSAGGTSVIAQVGLASWYGGPRWQGRATSSGTLFDENSFTAAHASLPLGSQALVTLVGTDREVIVTINDRPGTSRRVIDLSRSAASELGILSRGVATVTVRPL